MDKKITKCLLFALATTTTLGVSGCSYLDRHEGVTSYAGDTLAANEAKMVVDPWPDQFDDTDIPADSQKMSNAVKRYQTGGKSSKPAGGKDNK